MSKEEFIEKSKIIHNNKYDYSKVEFVNKSTKVCIICPIHGEFWQRPTDHLRKKGCQKCGGNEKITTEEFIKLANKFHNYKYDYSKVNYINAHTKVCIICPEHGEFWQEPTKHLHQHGCSKCGHKDASDKLKMNKEDFIRKAIEIHGNIYDYSKVEYVNNHTKVCIICPKHGEFWQTPDIHLNGSGCKFCRFEHMSELKKKTLDDVVSEFKEIHGDKYDYSKVNYINTREKVCIICPKHGEFWQTPDNHLHGKGCPICNESKLENTVRGLLESLGIEYVNQKSYSWLVWNKPMRLDFYIPKYNVAIECQGIQHFAPSNFFGGINNFTLSFERDKIKKRLCDEHGIKIFYFSNLGIEYPYKVYEDFNEMMDAIKLYYEEQKLSEAIVIN